jgi:phosphoglycolate phosphatase-like HAD superfamily hydrolase
MFDVEGTLVDCVHETLKCWQRTFAEFGFEFALSDLQRYSGCDPDDMMKALLPEPECERLASTLKKRHGKRYRNECLPKVKAFPGVRALFERLAAAGCPRTLVTSCARDELEHYMKLMRIGDLVACVACGEEVDRQKPHPDLIDLALTKNGSPATRAIMVGDTPFDAAAAQAAGVPAIGLLCGGFSSSALRAAGCKGTYRDPRHLKEDLPSWLDASNA